MHRQRQHDARHAPDAAMRRAKAEAREAFGDRWEQLSKAEQHAELRKRLPVTEKAPAASGKPPSNWVDRLSSPPRRSQFEVDRLGSPTRPPVGRATRQQRPGKAALFDRLSSPQRTQRTQRTARRKVAGSPERPPRSVTSGSNSSATTPARARRVRSPPRASPRKRGTPRGTPRKEEVRRIFSSLDADADGMLSRTECEAACGQLVPHFNNRDVRMWAFGAADTSGNGLLEHKAFRVLLRYLAYLDSIAPVLSSIRDASTEGKLSVTEFNAACVSLGYALPAKEIATAFAMMNSSEPELRDQGVVRFEAFVEWIARHSDVTSPTAISAAQSAAPPTTPVAAPPALVTPSTPVTPLGSGEHDGMEGVYETFMGSAPFSTTRSDAKKPTVKFSDNVEVSPMMSGWDTRQDHTASEVESLLRFGTRSGTKQVAFGRSQVTTPARGVAELTGDGAVAPCSGRFNTRAPTRTHLPVGYVICVLYLSYREGW